MTTQTIIIQHTHDELRQEARELLIADHTLAQCKAPEVGRFRVVTEEWHEQVMALLAELGGGE